MGPRDRWLLTRLVGDPAMMEHLGGAESLAKIDERQARYEQPDSHCLKIVTAEGEACSWVGFWERAEPGAPGLEIGWAVAPEFQGRGLAQAGARLAVPCARAFTRERGHTGAAATVWRSRPLPMLPLTGSVSGWVSPILARGTSSTRREARCAAGSGAWTCSPNRLPRDDGVRIGQGVP